MTERTLLLLKEDVMADGGTSSSYTRPQEIAKEYLAEHRVQQMFSSLLSALMMHKPEDPITFIQGTLDEVRCQLSNLFTITTNITKLSQKYIWNTYLLLDFLTNLHPHKLCPSW